MKIQFTPSKSSVDMALKRRAGRAIFPDGEKKKKKKKRKKKRNVRFFYLNKHDKTSFGYFLEKKKPITHGFPIQMHSISVMDYRLKSQFQQSEPL